MANVLTPEFRVSFPSVFKPKRNDLSGKDEYSVVALFNAKADLTKLKAAFQKAISDKWGPDKAKWPPNIRNPFRDQGDRVKNVEGKDVMPSGYEKGAIYLNLKSASRPGVVDEKVEAIIDEAQFYPGCYARATVNAYAYDQKGNKGVSFGLVNLQKVKDGEPFGRRTKPEDDFAPVEMAGDSSGSAMSMFD